MYLRCSCRQDAFYIVKLIARPLRAGLDFVKDFREGFRRLMRSITLVLAIRRNGWHHTYHGHANS